MNLIKLFETQKVLRDRINYNEPDRFNKLILALLVEIGECANEWRGFKFWSQDQEPRVKVPVTAWGEPYKNLLLEEYVDGLHFVLELGIEIDFKDIDLVNGLVPHKTATEQFIAVFNMTNKFSKYKTAVNYLDIFDEFIALGEILGFTWEQIEEAYYKKNQINHDRQDNGY